MEIKFYVNTSEENACRPNLSNEVVYVGTLRNDVEQSIMRPSILVQVTENDTTLFTKNYCYIEDFGRYYHITDIKSVRNCLVRLDLKSDPLASFFEEFGQQDAVIERAENYYNLFLKDGKLPVEVRTEYDKYVSSTTPFSQLNYIGVCAGVGTGGASGTTQEDEFTADGTNNIYYLSAQPIPGSITVTVNGTATTAWRPVSDGQGNTYIAFTTVQAAGSLIIVRYRTL